MNGTYENIDCMELMANLKDKEIDLAIVDPPYGIIDKIISGGNRKNSIDMRKEMSKYDIAPSGDYFNELMRVSKNQIIWGANYFTKSLPHSRGWIVWDKTDIPFGFSMAMSELAFSSFNTNMKIVRLATCKNKIHANEKPVKLYEWLLSNYAKPNDLILDTHCGSASSLIACENLGFRYIASELDKDYYHQSLQRLEAHLAQGKLFQRVGRDEIQISQPSMFA
jgi:site-specific DNA-methyltransferase (adenine-specific)